MPTITDLLKAEGVEITPELAAKIPTLVEASDEVRGLVTAKQELHEWKQSNVDKVANFESMELKSIEDLKAREELAIANKDFQAQIEIRDEREKKQSEVLKIRNEQALKGSQESAQLEIASLFGCAETGKSLAKNFVNSTIGEDGNISKSYNLNGETFDSFEGFKQSASKVEWLAAQMKGPESSGPTSNGGTGNHAVKQSRSNMTPDAKMEFVAEHGQEAFLKLDK